MDRDRIPSALSGLRAVPARDKTVPYVSTHGNAAEVRENPMGRQVDAYAPGETVWQCRHRSAWWLEAPISGRRIDYTEIDSLEKESAALHPTRWHDIKARAATSVLVDEDRFGAHLAQEFEVMRRRGIARGALYVSTIAPHALAVDLEVKYGNTAHPEFVVRFYDPNRPRTHVRTRTFDPATNSRLSLRDFMLFGDDFNVLGTQPGAVGIFSTVPMEPGAARQRAMGSVDSMRARLHIAVANNVDAELRALRTDIPRIGSEREREAILRARNTFGIEALSAAMDDPTLYAAIARWGDIVLKADLGRNALLRTLGSGQRMPPVWRAMSRGYALNVREWGKIVLDATQLDDDDVFTLLAGVCHGCPALTRAMSVDRHEAIAEWGALVRDAGFSQETRARRYTTLLKGRFDEETALSVAMRSGHASSVRAWGNLVCGIAGQLRSRDVVQLLESRAAGSSALAWAMHENQPDAIAEWGRVLNAVRLSADEVERLLLAGSEDRSALDIALEMRNADAIDAYHAIAMQNMRSLSRGARQAVYAGLRDATRLGLPPPSSAWLAY